MKNIIASVIVPAYNAEKTIGRCIDSLLNQTLKSIEVIVVDDGSTDNTSLVCNSYCDERLKLIYKENGGVSSARNKGLEIANGEYILFCDSDDWVENYFVEGLCKGFEKANIDLVVCGIYLNDIQNEKMSLKSIEGNDEEVLDASGFIRLREKDLLAYPVNKAFRKKVISENSLCFDVNLCECEDLVFNLNYISNMKSDMVVIPDALYHYEFSGDSLSTKYHNDRFFDVIRPIFAAYEMIISKLGIKDSNFLSEIYSAYFLKTIENIPLLWDKRNTFGLVEKLLKVKKIVSSEEYSLCFQKMNKTKFNKVSLMVYGSRCWLLVLIFMKIYSWDN